MARGHLFLDLYRVRQALSWDDFKNLQHILTAEEVLWITATESNHVLYDVCNKGLDKSDTRAENTTKSTSAENSKNDSSGKRKGYRDYVDHLLLFIRHVAQHGADHSKIRMRISSRNSRI